jgi:hypothetical protein
MDATGSVLRGVPAWRASPGRSCASAFGVEIETASDRLAVMSSGLFRYGM